jgi:hypothetical protein
VTHPEQLHFEITHRFRPVHLIPPRLVEFDTDRPATPATGPAAAGAVRAERGPAAAWASVILDVAELAEGGSVRAGLATADGDAVWVRYDAAARRVVIEAERAGETRELSSADAALAAPFRLACVVTGNAVGAFSSGGGHSVPGSAGRPWQALLTDQGRLADVHDLYRPALVGALRYAYAADAARLARVQAGPFGQLGLRDLCLVRNADGTPYRRPGDEAALYFTATSSGVGYVHQAHCGVWRVDPEDPASMEQVGTHFFSYEGLLVGNHAGQLLYDGERGRFIALACGGNLPTPGVTVRHATSTDDLLTGVHTLSARRVELPRDHATWDPSLRLIDGRWTWAYVDVTDFQPALRFRPVLAEAAPGEDYARGVRVLHRDAAAPNNNEGCRLLRFGDAWYLVTSDPEARSYLVRDLRMRTVGTLDAPYPLGTPFAEVFPAPGPGGEERWLMVTSDETGYEGAHGVLGYGVHGDVIVMRAA